VICADKVAGALTFTRAFKGHVDRGPADAADAVFKGVAVDLVVAATRAVAVYASEVVAALGRVDALPAADGVIGAPAVHGTYLAGGAGGAAGAVHAAERVYADAAGRTFEVIYAERLRVPAEPLFTEPAAAAVAVNKAPAVAVGAGAFVGLADAAVGADKALSELGAVIIVPAVIGRHADILIFIAVGRVSPAVIVIVADVHGDAGVSLRITDVSAGAVCVVVTGDALDAYRVITVITPGTVIVVVTIVGGAGTIDTYPGLFLIVLFPPDGAAGKRHG